MRELTIAVAQAASFPGCVDRNLDRLHSLAHECLEKEAGLLCLPEAFLTGHDRHAASEIALDAIDSRLEAVEAIARTTGVTLSYGYIERNPNDEAPFVTHVVTDGTDRLVYRKTHLGPHEEGFFSAGDQLPVATVANMRIGVHLCWEAHIPQIAATLRRRGAELLIVPFASGLGGQQRRESWMRFLPARASDNGCYLVACNALRPSDNGSTLAGGGAIVFDTKGAVLTEAFSNEESLIMTAITEPLPRELAVERMGTLSYFDHQRPELYA